MTSGYHTKYFPPLVALSKSSRQWLKKQLFSIPKYRLLLSPRIIILVLFICLKDVSAQPVSEVDLELFEEMPSTASSKPPPPISGMPTDSTFNLKYLCCAKKRRSVS